MIRRDRRALARRLPSCRGVPADASACVPWRFRAARPGEPRPLPARYVLGIAAMLGATRWR
jgi:hypothetical protein